MDLDKPMYAGCYKLVMENGLLAPGGIMLCDNVLYRGRRRSTTPASCPRCRRRLR